MKSKSYKYNFLVLTRVYCGGLRLSGDLPQAKFLRGCEAPATFYCFPKQRFYGERGLLLSMSSKPKFLKIQVVEGAEKYTFTWSPLGGGSIGGPGEAIIMSGIPADLSYVPGQPVAIASASDPVNDNMRGIVLEYSVSGGEGELTVYLTHSENEGAYFQSAGVFLDIMRGPRGPPGPGVSTLTCGLIGVVAVGVAIIVAILTIVIIREILRPRKVMFVDEGWK